MDETTKTFMFLGMAAPHITKMRRLSPSHDQIINFACGHYRVVGQDYLTGCLDHRAVPVCEVEGCTLTAPKPKPKPQLCGHQAPLTYPRLTCQFVEGHDGDHGAKWPDHPLAWITWTNAHYVIVYDPAKETPQQARDRARGLTLTTMRCCAPHPMRATVGCELPMLHNGDHRGDLGTWPR